MNDLPLDLFDMGVAMNRFAAETLVVPGSDPAADAAAAGIKKAAEGAGEEWVARAVAKIRERAWRRKSFTTDELIRWMGDDQPSERRAYGAAIRQAVKEGVVRPSRCPCCGQQRVESGPARNHGRKMAVWFASR